MTFEPKIPLASPYEARRFAIRLGLFYAAMFGLAGSHLPFFPVWLKAVGIDAAWIGIILAVPALTRFTVLPFVTGLAERRRSLRLALIVTALLTASGFAMLGWVREAIAIFIVFAMTACVWTPILPLTDAYALRGVAQYRLHYGPLRLWGSAAFVLGALGCGLLVDRVAGTDLIWIMAGLAALGAATSFVLRPLEAPKAISTVRSGAFALLRQPAFLAVIVAAALIQGSHAAYYSFASIAWQASGLSGATIAGMWVLGVLAEIVIFALSPRFTLAPMALMMIGALGGVLRWLVTAQEPSLPLLATVQLMHGLTYGLTVLGTMALLVRIVPGHFMARAQGYLAACSGISMSIASVLSGLMYARFGHGIYYGMMAMAAGGAVVIWLARRSFDRYRHSDAQPHNSGVGG